MYSSKMIGVYGCLGVGGGGDKAFFFSSSSFFFVGASTTDLTLTPQAVLLSVCLFSQGSWAVWLSALSGLSSQDTNLSSIKIAVRLFFCLAWTMWPLGKGFLGIISIPGYSQPFLEIQYQNNTLYSCAAPSSSNLCCWCHYCTSQSLFSVPI